MQGRCRQRPLEHRRQRGLEFVRRRHADQDGAHRRVRDGEARRRFGQATPRPFGHQRHQPPRPRQIGVVAQGRADRLRRRAGDRMAFGHAGQRTAGQHADADDADAGLLRVVEQPPVVLRRIVRRQRHRGRRVQHVVADLGAVEAPESITWCSAAVSPTAVMPRNRVLPCSRSVWNAGTTSSSTCCGAEALAAAVRGDGVVQVEDVDVVHAEPPQAAVQRRRDGAAMRPNSAGGSRTLVPTIALAGFSVARPGRGCSPTRRCRTARRCRSS